MSYASSLAGPFGRKKKIYGTTISYLMDSKKHYGLELVCSFLYRKPLHHTNQHTSVAWPWSRQSTHEADTNHQKIICKMNLSNIHVHNINTQHNIHTTHLFRSAHTKQNNKRGKWKGKKRERGKEKTKHKVSKLLFETRVLEITSYAVPLPLTHLLSLWMMHFIPCLHLLCKVKKKSANK